MDVARRGATPWRDADAQVLVEELGAPHLGPDELHHLSRVLRLRAGAVLCATDGEGSWRLVAHDGTATPPTLGPVAHEPRPAPALTVAFAPAKGDRPELVVQKLTELGVDRIVPVVTGRSVVRWDRERGERQLGRWRRIAREACCQCRRLHVPEVVGAPSGGVLTLAELLGGDGAGPPVVGDPSGRPLAASDRFVLIGPEGGWAPGEVDGLEQVAFSANVLRAETAAIAAGALLAAWRDGWVGTTPMST